RIAQELGARDQRADPEDVQEARRGGRRDEVAEAVQRAREEAARAGEDEVGEEDLREGEGEVGARERRGLELLEEERGLARERAPPAGRERRERYDDRREDEDEPRRRDAREARGALLVAALARLDEDGDERLRERALAEDPPEEVRDRPGEEERVGDRP